MEFEDRKRAVLQALAAEEGDKSRKGGVDAPIADLIERINWHPCFFTTSSCSGRVSLFLDFLGDVGSSEQGKKKKKKGGDWIFVSHKPVDARQVVDAVLEKYQEQLGLLVFKFEPFILALECSTAAAAQQLVSCAVASGFRESGITSLGKRVMAAVRCSIRLEVPVAKAGQLLVSQEYLVFLTKLANEKMELNRVRTDKFLHMFTDQVECCPAFNGSAEETSSTREAQWSGHLREELSFSSANGSAAVSVACRTERMVVDGKELEAWQKNLLQLERRQMTLLAGLDGLEASLGLVSCCRMVRNEGSETVRGEMRRYQEQGRARAVRSVDEALRPYEVDSQRGATCKSPDRRQSSVFAGKEHILTGVGKPSGCSFPAAPLILSGEPVEKLHRWSHTACAVSVAVNSKQPVVMVFGGYGGPGRHARLNDLLLLDVERGTLNVEPRFGAPSARQGHACAVVEDKMVVIGGRKCPKSPLGDVWSFSLTTRNWSCIVTTGALFPPRHRHACAAVGSNVYVFGGMHEREIYDDLFVLDTSVMKWTKLNCNGDLPSARHSHSLVAVKQSLYLFGGRNEKKIYGDLYVFEVVKNQWRRVETSGVCPVPRFSHSMTSCGEFLAVLGGCPITRTSKDLLLLHSDLLKWQSVTLSLPFGVFPVRHSVCALGNKLLVIGGGAACFAFGSAFNPPFVLDLDPILVRASSTQKTSFFKVKPGILANHNATDGDESENWVLVLPRSDGKQGKDMLKALGWLDLSRKAKVLESGHYIAFPVTTAAASCLASEREEDASAYVIERTDFVIDSERLNPVSANCHFPRGKLARALLPVDTRRQKGVHWSLQDEVGRLLEKRNLPLSLLSEMPKRWEHLGDMALLPASSFTGPIWHTLGADLWSTLARALGVCRLARQAAVAPTGTRDSRIELLLGNDGWVEHRENGLLYCFDATKCMYSSGNVSEKLRVAAMPCFGEVVVDLFAGIGYYVLPFLVKAAARHVYACEWNPSALQALRHNLRVNSVEDRCTIIEGDSRIMAPERVADRVCLGLLPTSEGSWNAAVRALRHSGGLLHVHENVKDNVEEEWVRYLLKSLRSLAFNQGLNWHISVSHVERVKWYAPHIRHIVVDVQCKGGVAASDEGN